jgi:hypothetical protein
MSLLTYRGNLPIMNLSLMLSCLLESRLKFRYGVGVRYADVRNGHAAGGAAVTAEPRKARFLCSEAEQKCAQN